VFGVVKFYQPLQVFLQQMIFLQLENLTSVTASRWSQIHSIVLMLTNFPSKAFTNALISVIVIREMVAFINGTIMLPADSIRAVSSSACEKNYGYQ